MDLDDIVTEIFGAAGPILEAITWAEQEINAAQTRHAAAADQIWDGFLLLRPTSPLMRTESVYRAHCRELLDRVAHRKDTRPGTAAECCLALSETSLRVPLSTTAAGLYARMWRSAGLPQVELTDSSSHYEALEGSAIDDQERWLRRKLRQSWRTLPRAGQSAATPPLRRPAL